MLPVFTRRRWFGSNLNLILDSPTRSSVAGVLFFNFRLRRELSRTIADFRLSKITMERTIAEATEKNFGVRDLCEKKSLGLRLALCS